MKLFKLLTIAGASMAVSIGSAFAMPTLSVEDPGDVSSAGALDTTKVPDTNFQLDLSSVGIIDPNGLVIDIFGTGPATYADTGLSVDGPATVTFTYLGSEAVNDNELFQMIVGNTKVFQNFGGPSKSEVGDTESFAFGAGGFIPFSIVTDGAITTAGQVINGDSGSDLVLGDELSIAFHILSATEVIVFLGDGLGDTDFDDLVFLVSVSEIPVPGAALLFGSALLGGTFLRRRKQIKA